MGPKMGPKMAWRAPNSFFHSLQSSCLGASRLPKSYGLSAEGFGPQAGAQARGIFCFFSVPLW
jgi:hypothetical protein